MGGGPRFGVRGRISFLGCLLVAAVARVFAVIVKDRSLIPGVENPIKHSSIQTLRRSLPTRTPGACCTMYVVYQHHF